MFLPNYSIQIVIVLLAKGPFFFLFKPFLLLLSCLTEQNGGLVKWSVIASASGLCRAKFFRFKPSLYPLTLVFTFYVVLFDHFISLSDHIF